MKPYLLLILPEFVLLLSCSTYKYVTLESDEVKKNDNKEFVWENDSLKLTYNFHGEGGPITIIIDNKTQQPLFVNWKKSALILKGESESLFNSKINISGTVNGGSYPVTKGYKSSSADISASFSLPEGMDIIPPKAYITRGLLNVQQTGLPDLSTVPDIKNQKIKDKEGNVIKLLRKEYEESESPVQFKSYLTFNFGNNAATEFFIQHSFYGKEILQTKKIPDWFFLYDNDGDKFYIR